MLDKKKNKLDSVKNQVDSINNEDEIGNLGEDLMEDIENEKDTIAKTFKENKIEGGNKTFKEKFIKGLKVSGKVSWKMTKIGLKNPGKTIIAGLIISTMSGNVIDSFGEDMGNKLSSLQENSVIENPLDTLKNERVINTLASNENILNEIGNVNTSKYEYSFYKNSNGKYTFLGYGSNVNKVEDIKLLSIKKGIDFNNVEIKRASTDEEVYHTNLILESKSPSKMKALLSNLTKEGDDMDRDNNFKSIFIYNINNDLYKKYDIQIKEIEEFGNIKFNIN